MLLFLCPKYLPFDAYWHDESCPFPILGNIFFTYSPCFRSFFPLFFDISFLHTALTDAAIGVTVVIAQINRCIFVKLFQKFNQLPYRKGSAALFCGVSGSVAFNHYCVIHVTCSFVAFVLTLYPYYTGSCQGKPP